jgi:hypothetical protein
MGQHILHFLRQHYALLIFIVLSTVIVYIGSFYTYFSVALLMASLVALVGAAIVYFLLTLKAGRP